MSVVLYKLNLCAPKQTLLVMLRLSAKSSRGHPCSSGAAARTVAYAP